MNTQTLIEKLQNGELDDRLLDIYVDNKLMDYQRNRYIVAIKKFEDLYDAGEVVLFSAPGRSEVGGNHTDHQHGKVLATSINLDSLGVVRATDDNTIRLVSDNYDEIVISLDDILLKEEEKETTTALIKGVVSGFLNRKFQVGGFKAYVTSDVLIGAGLSSSAAFGVRVQVRGTRRRSLPQQPPPCAPGIRRWRSQCRPGPRTSCAQHPGRSAGRPPIRRWQRIRRRRRSRCSA